MTTCYKTRFNNLLKDLVSIKEQCFKLQDPDMQGFENNLKIFKLYKLIEEIEQDVLITKFRNLSDKQLEELEKLE